MTITQTGPPDTEAVLSALVSRLIYKPGWTITVGHMQRQFEHLADGEGFTLRIETRQPDSRNPSVLVGLDHYFAVPPADYDEITWERWVLECVIQVETHEALEYFKVDGWAPYFPPHGNRCRKNPYTINRRTREGA